MSIMSRPLTLTLVLTAAALHLGCSNGASNLLTTGAVSTGGSSSQVADQALTRSTYMGRIAAGAKRCGFSEPPESIWQAYRAFEARQGATQEQLVRLESAYQAGLKSENEAILPNPDYCTGRKIAEIKLAFQSQAAGDYSSMIAKAQADKTQAENCGFLGCPIPLPPEKPFDSSKFFKDRLKDPDQTR